MLYYITYADFAKALTCTFFILPLLTLNAPDAEPYAVSDEIVSKGWTPNESYPYPLPNEVTYEYPTIVKGIDINGGEVSSISVMVQGDQL